MFSTHLSNSLPNNVRCGLVLSVYYLRRELNTLLVIRFVCSIVTAKIKVIIIPSSDSVVSMVLRDGQK